MTPLNSILSNTKIVYNTLLQMMQDGRFEDRDSLKMLGAVQQSGMIMWYFNQNQIQRMQINKNQFHQKLKLADDV